MIDCAFQQRSRLCPGRQKRLRKFLKKIFDKARKMEARKEDWITAVLPENAPDSCKAGKN
jgi:hypothetical protein